MMIFLKFIVDHWKDIAIAIVLGFLVYVVFSWWGGEAEIARLNLVVKTQAQQIDTLSDQVAAYQKSSEELKAKAATASKERAEIANMLSKEINIIKNRPMPKECDKAIQYGIQYKGDLSWPGQQ